MRRPKIIADMSRLIVRLSNDNIEAFNILLQMARPENQFIDPSLSENGFHYMMMLDQHEIYKEDICVLWNDICEKDMRCMYAVLRSIDFGLLTAEKLREACSCRDGSGRLLICVQELYEEVRKRIHHFGTNIPFTAGILN